MLRFLTAGESHGEALAGIVEGLPAGMPLSHEEIEAALARRRGGYGRGERMKAEADALAILSGLHDGSTTGAPLAFTIGNSVRVVPQDGDELTRVCPRPGHADLAGGMKFRIKDFRVIAERASARETAARVVVGSIARQYLRLFAIHVLGWVESLGSVAAPRPELSYLHLRDVVEASPLRVPDAGACRQMMLLIDEAAKSGDTLGGVFAVGAWGVPPGLGTYAQADGRLDGLLAQALVSIPAVKGAEVGRAFENAALPGSVVHDEILYDGEYRRRTNRAGGVEGGITNGETVLVRAAMKPIPTLAEGLATVNVDQRAPARAPYRRSDVTALPAASVVGEAVVAWVLLRALREKLGGDTVEEMQASWREYREYLARY